MKKLPVFVAVGLLVFTLIVVLTHAKQAYSAASHVVVSEVQLAGGTSTDEFVELYNPTGSSIALTNWKLTKKTASGTESDLVPSLSGTIPSLGYFLVAHTAYDGTPTADITYSTQSLADNNTVLLYDQNAILVDKVGFGTATDRETTTVANPTANHSVERKTNASSTTGSMGPSGSDETQGNGEDTDVNSADFVSRTLSQPQNSSSSVEPEFAPTATPTPVPSDSPTPTENPTPLLTPSPSQEPTTTPTPTLEPTPTSQPSPTATNTPSPTDSPTPQPSPSPEPSATPTPSTTPLPTPTPTPWPHPTPRPITYWNPLFQCTITYRPLWIMRRVIFFPKIDCSNHDHHEVMSRRTDW